MSVGGRAWRSAVWPVAGGVCLLLPLGLPAPWIPQVAMIGVYIVALLGLGMLTTSGRISLGHGALFSVGAYMATLLARNQGIPILLSVPLVAVVLFGVGYLFALPLRRLRGLYLAIATIALGVLMPQVYLRLGGLTGGSAGLRVPPLGLPDVLSDRQWAYLVTALVTLVLTWFSHNLFHSRYGLASVTLREREVVALVGGVNVARHISLLFALSGLYTGVAGALFAMVVGYINPDSFGLTLSFNLVIGIILGGAGTVGAIAGAIFLQLMPDLFQVVQQVPPGIGYGTAVLLVIVFAPQGAAGAVDRLLRARRCSRSAAPLAYEPTASPAASSAHLLHKS